MRTVALVLLLVALAVADLAPLLHTDGDVIPNSYIVILKDGLDALARDAHINELKDNFLANPTALVENKIGFVYGIGSMMGFSAVLSDDMLKAQLAHPNVKYVEADQVMSINAATTKQSGATWGLDRIDQRNLPVDGSYTYLNQAGSGIDVFVIDTGILATHQDFSGRAKSVFNAITNEPSTDQNGHGTHCAGTIGGTTYGVAKKVNLFGVKVLSASGSGSTSGVVSGVNYVTNNHRAGKAVASMSLGGGASTTMDQAVQNSIASGVPYAIAAGNSNANACSTSPARVATAVTVGATTSSDARASYSNFGNCLDIFAPGSSITSDWIGSNTAINTISGTSMATPHVAGVMALHLSVAGTMTPAALSSWLQTQATPGKVTSPGTGSPNLLLYSPY